MQLNRLSTPDAPQVAASSTVVRRFAGVKAVELAILCRPGGGSQDTASQADAAYRSLVQRLAQDQASFRDLTCETLFLSDIRRELPLVLDARARVLSGLGEGSDAPLPAFIQQAPLDVSTGFALSASAVVPSRRDSWLVRDVVAVPSCRCEACALTGARVTTLGDQVSLHTTNLYGAGSDTYEQSWNMFCSAEHLLQQCGMRFGDVVRTWIHLRDIDRDYDALNRARREFFRTRGIELRPASTAVQGAPWPESHDCAMSLRAVRSAGTLGVSRMSTPSLNEAWSYGADFSRGLRVAEANGTTLYVSGTASLDEAGRTVHLGDFDAQAERMLDNIESLLAGQGAGLDNLMSGVTYVKHPHDAPRLHSIFRRRGFDRFPCPVVQAGLCRPELLCETEAVAMVHAGTKGA